MQWLVCLIALSWILHTDDVSSIMNQGKDLANLFKRRCGVGIDISTLRPDGSSVSNSAGSTTGAWSFAGFL